MLARKLVYGVMVTQLFLVQSFKVRVLVDQQKASQLRGFFYGINLSLDIKIKPFEILRGFVCNEDLYFKCQNWFIGVVYQIFRNASGKEMVETCSSMSAKCDQVGIFFVRIVDNPFFYVAFIVCFK
jgi:hypothetical protein